MSSSGKLPSGMKALPGYEVGFAKPPVTTRFKPGQSGNPKGRPRGAKNKRPGMQEERLKDIILDEAYRGITVRDGNRSVTIPMVQAVIRSMAVNAAKGQHRSQRLFAELLASTESSRKILHDAYFDAALTYKLEWDKELLRRKVAGITHLPDPLPHPDQIEIDFREGTVRLVGPLIQEEKLLVDQWRAREPEIAEAVELLRADLENISDPEECGDIQKHINIGEKILNDIRKVISR